MNTCDYCGRKFTGHGISHEDGARCCSEACMNELVELTAQLADEYPGETRYADDAENEFDVAGGL